MIKVRLFRIYDLTFFLDKKSKIICLINRVRYTGCQLSLINCLLDYFGLTSLEISAVCYTSPAEYYWGGLASLERRGTTSWINWLIASEKADNLNLPLLLDFLVTAAGNEQMKYLAAVVDENQWFCSSFRLNGFSIYSRQCVWHLCASSIPTDEHWTSELIEPFNECDLFLQAQIPPLIRQIGNNWSNNQVYILRKNNQIILCAKIELFKKQVYIEPVFHPEAENPGNLLVQLASWVCQSPEIEIRVAIPGFQAWLTESLLSEGFQIEMKQIIYVKNLAVKVTDEVMSFAFDQKKLQPIGPHQYHAIEKK